MKLSIFTTITDPINRGDNHNDAFICYQELADELVVVDGTDWTDAEKERVAYKKTPIIFYKWAKEFSWEFIGEQFTRGYEACTGDWVIKADLDYLFHENDLKATREALERHNDAPALSFWKYQFVQPDRYNLKSRLVIAVNKGKFGDRIKFDSGGDLCQVSLDGKYLTPDDVPEAKIPFYNYEKILKTKEQIAEDQGRMERAWFRHFGEYQMGSDGTDENAYKRWLEAQIGKYHKPQREIKLRDHPKYIQETIKNLEPHNWGYNGFGNLRSNNYV